MRRTLMGMAIVLSAVSALGQSLASGKATAANTDSQAQVQTAGVTSASYVIRPEDTISISVWRQPDFSGVIPVRPDGRVSMALVGDVVAAGKTPTQLAADITSMLKTYVEEPRVTVVVTAISSRKVFIIGEIARPGPIVMSPSMTVLEAIASAGGPTAYANSKKIFVMRTEDGKETKIPFNYKDALKGKVANQNIALKPGDTIVVP